MKDKYKIRPVKVEDFVDFISWWKSYDHCEVPSSDLLPNKGLGGFAIEIEGKVIAANFTYLTNSKIGYMDHLISDPNYKDKDKYKLLWELMEFCTEWLLKQGCTMIWAMTTYDHLAEMAKKQGHDVLDDKYYVMYTHHKIYGQMTKKNLN
jgi:hypothetical protein